MPEDEFSQESQVIIKPEPSSASNCEDEREKNNLESPPPPIKRRKKSKPAPPSSASTTSRKANASECEPKEKLKKTRRNLNLLHVG